MDVLILLRKRVIYRKPRKDDRRPHCPSPSIAFCTVYIGGIILKGVLALFDLWKKCKIEEERRIIGVSCEGYCGSQGKYVFGEVYAYNKAK